MASGETAPKVASTDAPLTLPDLLLDYGEVAAIGTMHMKRTETSAWVVWISCLLSLSVAGRSNSENVLLIEAISENTALDTINVLVYGVESFPVGSETTDPRITRRIYRERGRRISRSADNISVQDPIRIAIELAESGPVLVQLIAEGPLGRFSATRCYDGSGVQRDRLVLRALQSDSSETTGYDADGDGFLGDPSGHCADFTASGGLVACANACPASTETDCEPTDDSRFPGAPETCGDNIDQDCSDPWDNDSCVDRDGDGVKACGANPTEPCDCDDQDPKVNPNVLEGPDTGNTCNDNIDNNCDDIIDFCDRDGDGFPAEKEFGGSPDCDDTDSSIFPPSDGSERELCTEGGEPLRDEDCDGLFDELPDCQKDDLDGDGFADCSTGATPCDCNDCDPGIFPGAPDRCGNGIEENCETDFPCGSGDRDGDGEASITVGGADCDDSNPSIYPGAPEICGDGILQSCLADVSCDGDTDNDGYVGSSDCKEDDASRSPSATELCNTVDDNCNSVRNESTSTEFGCVPGSTDLPATQNASCSNGFCSINFVSDRLHCGQCRNACDTKVADTCTAGSCDCSGESGPGQCTGPDTCCPEGCENIETSLTSCGGCGIPCDVRADTCRDRVCRCGNAPACNAGEICCNGGCSSPNSISNCGGCGNLCSVNNGTASCNAPTCAIASCIAPFDDCDGRYSTGCETNTDNAPKHCGSCNNDCSDGRFQNASGQCNNGTCEIDECSPGFVDCTLEPGCETRENRGSCGENCTDCAERQGEANAVLTCSNGECAVSRCFVTHLDCNDDFGCETPAEDGPCP